MQRAELPTVIVEEFEGPYDVLLELVRKRRVDISTISLAKITEDFLQYVTQTPLAPAARADFLIVAATLVLLKLKAAVPSLTPEEEEEVAELTDRVKLYQLYRQASLVFSRNWHKAELQPGALRTVPGKTKPLSLESKGLVSSFERIQQRLQQEVKPLRHLRLKRKSLREHLDLLRERLRRTEEATFQGLFTKTDRSTIAASLLALLELTKQQYVTLEQKAEFGPITISPRKNS